MRGASCTTSGTTVGLACAMVSSDTNVPATWSRADIRAGSWAVFGPRLEQLRQEVAVGAAEDLGVLGGAHADPDDRQLRVLAAPRAQDLVEGRLAGVVGGHARTGAADVVARGDQHHAVVGEMRQGRPQHVVGADGVDAEGVHPGGDVGVLDVGEGHHGAREHDGVESAEGVGRGVDHPLDGTGVLDVELEGEAADVVGQLGQPVHAAGGDGDLGAARGGVGGHRVTDSGRRSDDEQPHTVGPGFLTMH